MKGEYGEGGTLLAHDANLLLCQLLWLKGKAAIGFATCQRCSLVIRNSHELSLRMAHCAIRCAGCLRGFGGRRMFGTPAVMPRNGSSLIVGIVARISGCRSQK